ncbi:MAG: hypothetical protein AAF602_12275 [Myxococcota bacterium]
MELRGTVYAAADVADLVRPLGGAPSGSVTPLQDACVVLTIARPLRFADGGSSPGIFVHDTTGMDGRFGIDVPDSLHDADACLTVHERADPVDAPASTYRPVYRSEPFPLVALADRPQHIFVVRGVGAASDGISQPEISAQVREVTSLDDVDSVSAWITSRGIAVAGEGRGTKITFEVSLEPSASVDLDALIRPSVSEFGIELVGIPTAGMPREAIESEIRKRVGDLVAVTREQLTDAIVSQVVSQHPELHEEAVRRKMARLGSLTFWRVRYPLVGHHERAIVADPAWGFPRCLTSNPTRSCRRARGRLRRLARPDRVG